MKTKSDIQVMREKYLLNKAAILACTGITEDDYNTHQFETAIEWLNKWSEGNQAMISKLSGNSFFWVWWANQWSRIDEQVLIDYTDHVLAGGYQSYLRAMWLKAHNVNAIVSYPSHAMLKRAKRRKEKHNV